jgi:hypothetical protein
MDLCDKLLKGTVQAPFRIYGGHIYFEDLVKHVDDELRGAYDTLMSAQLVLLWTTVETLAGDLWEAAVNFHPQGLASMNARGRATGQEGKSLPMSFLERNRYHIDDKMGTILKEHRRTAFQTFDNIKDTYQDTFPPECRASQDAFWDNRGVKTASAVRNLIVHRAGVVDDKFLRDCSGDSRVRGYNAGDQFYLDGESLSELQRDLTFFASELILEVDLWLDANPS